MLILSKMNRTSFFLGFLQLQYLISTLAAVWPAPRSIKQETQLFRLSSNFSIQFKDSYQSGDLQAAVSEALHQIHNDHHQLLQVDRGLSLYPQLQENPSQSELSELWIVISSTKPSLDRSTRCGNHINPLHLVTHPQMYHNSSSSCHSPPDLSIASEMQLPLRSRDESYELNVFHNAKKLKHEALLSAPSPLGILRGLQTFTQLVYTVKDPKNAVHEDSSKPTSRSDLRFIYGPVAIKDSPAFPYRGLLLDTSRNFYSIESIKKTLNAMSWVKLNTLHWHIVDSQSWPLELPTHPQLSRAGAYSSSQVYKLEEIKELTHYANSRGIEIMLEIDTPGHTAIIGEAFPDLVACKDATPWTTYAAEPPAGQLRLADDNALNLIVDIFSHVTREIPGTLFSSGGDEVNKKCYEHDEPTQESLRNKNITLHEALSNFVLKSHEVIRESGKTPVVWEEMTIDEDLNLPKEDTFVIVWRNSTMVKRVVDKGFPLIHGASDYSYLDCGLGGWLGNSINGTSWCDPFKTWQKIYSFDPYNNVAINQRKQILGGQALLWSEQADGQNMESLIWPRTLSIAELYWTGDSKARSVKEALSRIHDMRYRLVQRGIHAAPLQPQWCALRPGQCDLPPVM